MSSRRRLHKTLLWLHRYLSLSAGVFILILAVTGTVIAFESDIDGLWNRGLRRIEPEARPMLPASSIVAAAAAAYPQERVQGLAWPPDKSTAAVVFVQGGLRVFVNPYTGKITGSRRGALAILAWIHGFHIRLNAGRKGSKVVDAVTIVILFLAVSGIYLWWPLKRVTIQRGSSAWRLHFDLHNTVGIFSCLFLLALGVTGLGFPYGGHVFGPIQKRSGAQPAEIMVMKSAPREGAAPISLDQALQAALQALPGSTVREAILPHRPRDAYFVSLGLPGEPASPREVDHSWVFIDQYSGEPLSVFNSRTAPLAARLNNVNREIHVGNIYGYPSKILAALVSLLLAAQGITGFFLWWKRPKATVTGDA